MDQRYQPTLCAIRVGVVLKLGAGDRDCRGRGGHEAGVLALELVELAADQTNHSPGVRAAGS